MAQQGLIVRALIASPSDVQKERQAIPEVLASWNATHSLAKAVIIEPVKWESHSVPGLEGRPQGMINEQLARICDFLIGVFWTRLGTDTGVAPSGTAEEIEEFRKAGKPVLLYFSSRPVDPDSIDVTQYERLKTYRKELESQGLVERYHEVSELREKLARHINAVIDDLIQPDREHTDRGESSDKAESDWIVFVEQLETFARRLAADWSSERESEPYNLDDAKFILQSAASETVNFVSGIADDPGAKRRAPLQDLVRRMKSLMRHQLVMDGGKSYDEFWRLGDSIVADLEKTVAAFRAQGPERE